MSAACLAGDIRQSKPFAYQETNGVKEEVLVDCVSTGVGRVGFQLGTYDPARWSLIRFSSIPPTSEAAASIRLTPSQVDSLGSAYVTGATAAIDFPTTPGAIQTNYGGGDAFVAKLNPAGTALVYSTYLNGASGNGIAVDSAGNAYVKRAKREPLISLPPRRFSRPRQWVSTPSSRS